MSYAVEISGEAREDLYLIYQYIAYELLVKEAARRQIEHLEQAILSLDTMPERHAVFDASKWDDLRMIPVDSYCVFYTVNCQTMKVNIARVLYGKRNFPTILGE